MRDPTDPPSNPPSASPHSANSLEPTVSRSPTVESVQRPPRQYLLTGTSLGQPPIRFKLPAGRVVVGRGMDVDLNLPSAAVSRHHAAVTFHEGEFTVTDLSSTHGIILNGLRVVSADLRDGDILQFADIVLTFEER